MKNLNEKQIISNIKHINYLRSLSINPNKQLLSETYSIIPDPLLEKYKYLVCWSDVSSFRTLTESLIEKYQDLYDQILSPPFILKYKDLVDWSGIVTTQFIPKDLFEEILKINDNDIYLSYFFFINKHLHNMDWIQDFLAKHTWSDDEYVKKYLTPKYFQLYLNYKDCKNLIL